MARCRSRQTLGAAALLALAAAFLMACSSCAGTARPAPRDAAELVPIETFLQLLSRNQGEFDQALRRIDDEWDDRYAVMLIEMTRFVYPMSEERGAKLFLLFEKKTYIAANGDLNKLFRWVWQQNPGLHPQYAQLKAQLYSKIDPRFAAYFDDHTENARIRLDEVRWGGVRRDGIPPLSGPEMIPAAQASYLDDSNVVFGIEVAGDARAYPKRILAWHEMFKDTIGGVSINGVYCTLCGSMIVYRTVHQGIHHELGTSGFLYRSNKLMYDRETESLWSTIRGEPVIGPLVGKGIKLEPLSVVTTTWGEWKKKHGNTTVLSLATGHQRDYREGAAYRDYFATDELMFAVPDDDDRLKNKAEVLALRFGGPSAKPTAIAADYLAKRPIHHGRLGTVEYVILTDPSGANRVYASKRARLTAYDGRGSAVDSQGRTYRVSEKALVASDGTRLERLPAHRAFWFGWRAAHPDTILIQ